MTPFVGFTVTRRRLAAAASTTVKHWLLELGRPGVGREMGAAGLAEFLESTSLAAPVAATS